MGDSSKIKIPIHVSNKRALVWSPEDASILRSKYRITGTLIGTLPSVSQQNVFLGLPLLLMPEEVVLLVENGVAVLLDDSTSHRTSTAPELREWHAARMKSAHAQIALANEGSSSSSSSPVSGGGGGGGGGKKASGEEARAKGVSSPEALRKRAEREAMRAARRSAHVERVKKEEEDGAPVSLFVPDEDAPLGPAAGSSSSAIATSMPVPDDRAIPSSSFVIAAAASTTAPAPVLPDSLPPHTVHIPSTSDGLPWYNPVEYDTLSAASAAGIWAYPTTYEEHARCAVFRALSEKGYYMGGGIKFGGDWLVYPGDPLRYHSHFVATVYPRPTSTLRPIDIVALGRLGTATKKAHLLCGWDEENDSVDFYSIEWAGFG